MGKRKHIALLIIVAVIASLFIGCSGDDVSSSSSKTTNPSASQTNGGTQTTGTTKPTENEEEKLDKRAEEIMSKMSTDEKIGQMINLAFRYWNDDWMFKVNDDIASIVDKYHLGGVTLFSENFTDMNQALELTTGYQNAVTNGIPLFIAIDQEGGRVVRLADGCSLVGNMALGAIGSEETSYEAGKIIGEELKALGINVDFAPNVDVNSNPANPVINTRSFSEDADAVAKLGASFSKGLNDAGVMAAAKHFPGHGDTSIDTHSALPTCDKTLEELKSLELVSFKNLIESGVDMVMTAHITYPIIAGNEYKDAPLPATLSKTMVTGVLRATLGYEGVVTTDSLGMSAVTANFKSDEAALLAVKADIDMLLMPVDLKSNEDLPALDAVFAAINGAINDGSLSIAEIDDSVKRILKLKIKRGLFDNEETAEEMKAVLQDKVASDEHREAERKMAANCVTMLENKDNVIPLKADGKKVLFLIHSEDVQKSVEFAVGRLVSEGKIKSFDYECSIYGAERLPSDNKKRLINEADIVIMVTSTSSSWVTTFTNAANKYALEQGKKSIVISAYFPYDVALFTDASALMACYCSTGKTSNDENKAFGANIIGAIEVAFGAGESKGKLPVTIYSVFPNGVFDMTKVIYERGYSLYNK